MYREQIWRICGCVKDDSIIKGITHPSTVQHGYNMGFLLKNCGLVVGKASRRFKEIQWMHPTWKPQGGCLWHAGGKTKMSISSQVSLFILLSS